MRARADRSRRRRSLLPPRPRAPRRRAHRQRCRQPRRRICARSLRRRPRSHRARHRRLPRPAPPAPLARCARPQRPRPRGRGPWELPAPGWCSSAASRVAATRSTWHGRCGRRGFRRACRRELPDGGCIVCASVRRTIARPLPSLRRSCARAATAASWFRGRSAGEGLRGQRARRSCTIRAARGDRGHDGLR